MTEGIKKIIALLMSALILVTFVGCSEKGSAGSTGGVPDGEYVSSADRPMVYGFADPAHTVDSDIAETSFPIVENNSSDYKIVIPANPALGEASAAERLRDTLCLSAGVALDIIDDTQVRSGDKYLFVGATAQTAEAGIRPAFSELDESGYIVKTIGANCYMTGAHTYGVDNAVTGFLENEVGYAMYSGDEVTVVKLDTVRLRAFDEKDIPAIRYRASGSGGLRSSEYDKANKFNSSYWLIPRNSGNAWHNDMDYFPESMFNNPDDPDNYHPDWYATAAGHLCYRAHGNPAEYEAMLNEALNVVVEAMERQPDATRMTFTQPDDGGWCSCPACTEAINAHDGAYNTTAIMFLNDLMDKVNAYCDKYFNGKRIYIAFFAYATAVKAPARLNTETGKYEAISDAVKPHEGVAVMYAPISADFNHGFDEPENSGSMSTLQAFKDMGFPIFWWIYQLNLISYFAPYDNFNSMQANYQIAAENGVLWLYDQGQYDQACATAFVDLKDYLSRQLMWDPYRDVAELTDKYFASRFKQAAPAMRKFYDALRVRMQWIEEELNVSGWIGTETFYSAEAFPYGELTKYMDYIEQAYEAIEPLADTDPELYGMLHDRINQESLFPRFYLITLFNTMYSSQEHLDMQKSFQQDCGKLGVSNHREGRAISELWQDWGL